VPGVYIFKDASGAILYVGKAKSLRNRVSSYFQPISSLGPKTAKLVSLINSLEYIEVNSEIEALLLESSLIKKFQPPYNISSKDDKSPYYIHIPKEKFPRPQINHEPKNAIAGPFLSGFVARKILGHFRKIAPFHSTPLKLGRPCLYSHIGLCLPCPNDPTTTSAEYQKNIARLKRLLKGDFSKVLSALKKQMATESKSQHFEIAASLRDKIRYLDQLLQNPIPPEEYISNPNLVSDKRQESLDALSLALSTGDLTLHRIEMYDIANLSGTAATGAMTVAIDGQTDTRLYRHFTIRSKNTPDDVAMMKEMLTRRLKRTDWPKPDLIVLDGGKSQLSITKELGFPCPVISLAKQEEIIFKPTGEQIVLERNNPGLQLIQRLRDEAHRFSRRLHHKHRKTSLLE
jgi:excinuclease ABC subunit C